MSLIEPFENISMPSEVILNPILLDCKSFEMVRTDMLWIEHVVDDHDGLEEREG